MPIPSCCFQLLWIACVFLCACVWKIYDEAPKLYCVKYARTNILHAICSVPNDMRSVSQTWLYLWTRARSDFFFCIWLQPLQLCNVKWELAARWLNDKSLFPDLSSKKCWLYCCLIIPFYSIPVAFTKCMLFFSFFLYDFSVGMLRSRLHWPAPCGKCQPHRVRSQLAPVQSPFPDVPGLWPADRAQEHCQDDLLEQIWREDSICKGLFFCCKTYILSSSTLWI